MVLTLFNDKLDFFFNSNAASSKVAIWEFGVVAVDGEDEIGVWEDEVGMCVDDLWAPWAKEGDLGGRELSKRERLVTSSREQERSR